MLFDLKGKRRRTVQGVYLGLAILMGAGLVVFGIGSSVSGGLGDLFKGGNGQNQAEQGIQKKIDAATTTLKTNPSNQAALAQIVRGEYQLATASADPNTSEFTKDSRDNLLRATAAWARYEKAAEKPDPSLGRLVIQAYDGLGRLTPNAQDAKPYWSGAADAAEIVATSKPTAQNYVVLVQYASLAGQTRKADLAGKQAIKLAPKSQKKAAQQAVKQAKAAPTTQAQQSQGTGQAPVP
jgi:hypothetical protein